MKTGSKFSKFKQTFGNYSHAASALTVARQNAATNAPINERQGNLGQARLERAGIKSFDSALARLKMRPMDTDKVQKPRPMKMGFMRKH